MEGEGGEVEFLRRERETGILPRDREGWMQPAETGELAADQEDGGGAQP